MAKPKLTRAEKNIATEARIMESARTVFSDRGYHGASMDEVAADAGLSKGALYYRYAAKEDLFAALLDAWGTERTARLTAILGAAAATATSPGIRAQKAADNLVAALAEDDGWSRLRAEFAALANTDSRFAERLAAHTRAMRAAIAVVVDARAADLGVEFPIPSERLAVLIESLAGGIGAERLADGAAVPDELLSTGVSLLLSGVALAGRRV